ncbi:MmcQ/YjbR family DNA-binding protein [Myroides pelagicus]|uniref:MmcQ/YjbR family DNA-binding protein n=1 Tax=Myroides pelagicus TaxID=270914 RepID=A0A7K1GL68_9FLAO|nr:MmcQ/YjbR family DNA-binding protein [Myroides pelagicus]MEC4112575.1 MmcQ/YjbR family DNA-binding protein [Myroides pelagicus]MTH29548.1 MmcQ/YjbR family DNA-binding protein [Myroides pelagicus]
MELDELYAYCNAKQQVISGFPFDEHLLTFRIGGKIFAMIAMHFWEAGNQNIILKCDPDLAIELREKYSSITHGYTMNKKHWNTIYLKGGFSTDQLMEWIDHSYDLVVATLPLKERLSLIK